MSQASLRFPRDRRFACYDDQTNAPRLDVGVRPTGE